MIYIRCTQKLLKRMNGPDDLPANVTEPVSDGRLGEWYANVKSLPFREKSVVIFFSPNISPRNLLTQQGEGEMVAETYVSTLSKLF